MNQIDNYQPLIKQHKPRSGEIWYHYCSAESFMAIVNNKTIRLCDLRHMNDASELSLGESMFLDGIMENRNMDNNCKKIVQIVHELYKKRFVPISMSFSKNKDQLSQWRGYADDAKGFCLGFDVQSFMRLPVHLHKIKYDPETQKRLIQNAINKIATLNINNIDIKCLTWIAELFELFSIIKDESFVEEQEFRLVGTLFVDVDNNSALFDIHKDDVNYKDFLNEINFRLVNNIPTPYVDLNISKLAPIKQIVIGPNNHSEVTEIKRFMSTRNINNVEITKSSSTYINLKK